MQQGCEADAWADIRGEILPFGQDDSVVTWRVYSERLGFRARCHALEVHGFRAPFGSGCAGSGSRRASGRCGVTYES